MIRKITSFIALAVTTVPMIALTANIVQAQGSGDSPAYAYLDDRSLVRVVSHSQGDFKNLGKGQWKEVSLDGTRSFNFLEVGRVGENTFLLDQSRNVAIRLDFSRKMIVYTDPNRTFDLYKMSAVSSCQKYYYQSARRYVDVCKRVEDQKTTLFTYYY
jgi:hypothetical protein